MARKTAVGGSFVRTWAKSDEGQTALKEHEAKIERPITVGLRGKFSEDLIKLFHAANKDKRYVTGHVEPTLTVKGMRPTASGGKVPVQSNTTPSAIRAWAKTAEAVAAGVKVGERGRLAPEVIAAFAARPIS